MMRMNLDFPSYPPKTWTMEDFYGGGGSSDA